MSSPAQLCLRPATPWLRGSACCCLHQTWPLHSATTPQARCTLPSCLSGFEELQKILSASAGAVGNGWLKGHPAARIVHSSCLSLRVSLILRIYNEQNADLYPLKHDFSVASTRVWHAPSFGSRRVLSSAQMQIFAASVAGMARHQKSLLHGLL